MENTTKERLQKKLKKKKESRSKGSSESKIDFESNDIFDMISQVQNMLKTNPEMVSKVSSCINSLMGSPEIMQQIIQSQTLETSVSNVDSDACSKES